MRKALALAAASAAALLFTAATTAAPARDGVFGHGTIEAQPFNGDSFTVAATSGPLGEDPRGMVQLRTTIDTDLGSVTTTFHGDVSEGCLVVVANKAVAVGHLPEDEQYTLEGFGTIEYAALIVTDNGHPIDGQPVDEAFPVLLRASSAARVCAGLTPLGLTPIDHGNFVVEDAMP